MTPSLHIRLRIRTSAAQRRRRYRQWAQLLRRRVYALDPLTCRECGGPLRILAFIQPRRSEVLAHLERRDRHPLQAPPERIPAPTRVAS